VMVLRQGAVVEQGPCAQIFADPKHPYTRALLEAIPLPDVDPGWVAA
jgi:oligopeptide/dipeptide ABC transporter ATP-binding protein